VACELSFSILKVIKTRLRNTMNEDKLEAFMLMASNKDILNNLDSDQVIELLKNKSKLFLRELSYQGACT